jgi:pimeloyl-ACP methyl ester carboxylesterase
MTNSAKIHFIESRSRDIPDSFLRIVGPTAPTLVAIHGISRNAAEIATRFASHPDFVGVNIVAPLFDRKKFGKYQQLQAASPDQPSSDKALFKLLNGLTVDHGIDTRRVLLFGFSGGAQMAHRIAMLYPGRVRALCVAAAGWYMMPDPHLLYPYGLGDAPGQPADIARAASIPTTVVIGTLDNRVDANVNQDAAIIDRQGRTRLRRARSWTREMAAFAMANGVASNFDLVCLDNGTHDFGQCVLEAGLLETVSKALLGKNDIGTSETTQGGQADHA